MDYAKNAPHYSQTPIYKQADFARIRNDMSADINTLKEQMMSLQMQQNEKELFVKHLKFLKRQAEAANDNHSCAALYEQIGHEKLQVKVLKNNRNRIKNVLFNGGKPKKQTSAKSRNTARLRMQRLARDKAKAAAADWDNASS